MSANRFPVLIAAVSLMVLGIPAARIGRAGEPQTGTPFFNVGQGEVLTYGISTYTAWTTKEEYKPKVVYTPSRDDGWGGGGGGGDLDAADPLAVDVTCALRIIATDGKEATIEVTPSFTRVKYWDNQGNEWTIPFKARDFDTHIRSQLSSLLFLRSQTSADDLARASIDEQILGVSLAHLQNRPFTLVLSRVDNTVTLTGFADTVKTACGANYIPEMIPMLSAEARKWIDIIFPGIPVKLERDAVWSSGEIQYTVTSCSGAPDRGTVEIVGSLAPDAARSVTTDTAGRTETNRSMVDRITIMNSVLKKREVTFSEQVQIKRGDTEENRGIRQLSKGWLITRE